MPQSIAPFQVTNYMIEDGILIFFTIRVISVSYRWKNVRLEKKTHFHI